MHESENKELALVEKYINQTNRSVFLTGKAGTGKTTFLGRLKTMTKKEFVITAPTGIAALNAGGVTLHSFFNLPNALFLPASVVKGSITNIITQEHILKNTAYTPSKLYLIKNLELLIIDEVSMLRADLLDMIDLLLRQIRSSPKSAFGGVQVLFIGDLFQLSPVLITKEEQVFSAVYPSRYFFDAKAVRQSMPIYIELLKVYRQSDLHFIGLLNKIRHNEIEQQDLDELNAKIAIPSTSQHKDIITLTSHISKVDAINVNRLSQLQGGLFSFSAQVSGKFDSKSFPGEIDLKIKVGAQVMVTKNDPSEHKRYYNGKIGEVHSIVEDGIFLNFDDINEPVLIQKESWKNITYGYENEKATLNTVGELKQFPIRLAWAVTIHKSQGLSFDNAIVDAAESFSEGQVYVALSRLTNFEGLYLSSPLSVDILKQNETVIKFIKECEGLQASEILLHHEIDLYIFGLLTDCFDWKILSGHLQSIIQQFDIWNISNKFEKLSKIEEISEAIAQQQETSEKLVRQLSSSVLNLDYILQRTTAARRYFENILEINLMPLVSAICLSAKTDKDQKDFFESLIKLNDLIQRKKTQLILAQDIATGLMNSLSPDDILLNYYTAKAPMPKEPITLTTTVKSKNNNKQTTQLKTYEFFNTGLSIPEIAIKRQLAIHVVEGHVTELIKAGNIKLQEVLADEKIEFLLPLIKNGNVDINELKIAIGNTYSFFELRAAINHVLRITETGK
ncbi:MAG: helix-turn-helix domain-containing protein [Bacteroidota bacterium]